MKPILTIPFLGFKIARADAHEIVCNIVDHINSRKFSGAAPIFLACLNPHSYVVSKSDDEFSKSLKSADWLISDGVGISSALRLCGNFFAARVTGSDIYCNLLSDLNKLGVYKIFFLGSTSQSLEAIEKNFIADYPNLLIVGMVSPSFSHKIPEVENDEILAKINSSGADILWVGMTAPKQEKWISGNLTRLNVGFIGAIGAVFDFYSGHIKRPPYIFRLIGLEWLLRLVGEPRRLWRRTFISGPVFIFDALKFILGFRVNR